MCLAQGLNAVPPVRLEPATLRSRVKHPTTEQLRSLPDRSVFLVGRQCSMGYIVVFKKNQYSPCVILLLGKDNYTGTSEPTCSQQYR